MRLRGQLMLSSPYLRKYPSPSIYLSLAYVTEPSETEPRLTGENLSSCTPFPHETQSNAVGGGGMPIYHRNPTLTTFPEPPMVPPAAGGPRP